MAKVIGKRHFLKKEIPAFNPHIAIPNWERPSPIEVSTATWIKESDDEWVHKPSNWSIRRVGKSLRWGIAKPDGTYYIKAWYKTPEKAKSIAEEGITSERT